MTTTIDALVDALEKISTGDAWHEDGVIGFAKEALARARAEQAAPSKYATLDNLKNWSLLAARALDDCHRVIETIEAESTEEENSLTELDARVYNLFNQALVMNGLLTRTQLDKATPFNRIELSATPPAAPANPVQAEQRAIRVKSITWPPEALQGGRAPSITEDNLLAMVYLAGQHGAKLELTEQPVAKLEPLSDAEIDALDKFSLAWMAPMGSESRSNHRQTYDTDQLHQHVSSVFHCFAFAGVHVCRHVVLG